jgi:ligand-binding sensor domain-containing protein
MKKSLPNISARLTATLVLTGSILLGLGWMMKTNKTNEVKQTNKDVSFLRVVKDETATGKKEEAKEPYVMPVYDNWVTFTTKDGLPSDKAFCVKIDGDRIWVGTKAGLALYENDTWRTFTEKDGLAHHGVLGVDISPVTGDVWVATLGGLSKYSAGKFDNYTQFNSGMVNDVIYQVTCDGKDVWVATGGGASKLDTYTGQWEIFNEQNAPMHEPWTYGITAGDGKVFIAAWGGGVIEYNKATTTFRDYVDPDGQMELDVFPNDGVVHDITSGVSFDDHILWVATYFGLSRYDGIHWNGYFDHDSGLASNFINFVRANGPAAWMCTDKGMSSFDSKRWITYKTNENGKGGEIIITEGDKVTTEKVATSISNNFVLGVDFQDDVIWVATSKGVSRGIARKTESSAKTQL